MSADPTQATDSSVEMACVAAHGRFYGVDVTQIREIVRSRELTPLPRAPALIEGVIDLRGVMLPVVDLGRVLGGAALEEGPATRIAVLEVAEMAFGLRVDAAVEVLSVVPTDLCDPPALATHTGYEAIRAVVRRDGAPPVLVLSLEHLLESVFVSALPEAPGASEGRES